MVSEDPKDSKTAPATAQAINEECSIKHDKNEDSSECENKDITFNEAVKTELIPNLPDEGAKVNKETANPAEIQDDIKTNEHSEPDKTNMGQLIEEEKLDVKIDGQQKQNGDETAIHEPVISISNEGAIATADETSESEDRNTDKSVSEEEEKEGTEQANISKSNEMKEEPISDDTIEEKCSFESELELNRVPPITEGEGEDNTEEPVTIQNSTEENADNIDDIIKPETKETGKDDGMLTERKSVENIDTKPDVSEEVNPTFNSEEVREQIVVVECESSSEQSIIKESEVEKLLNSTPETPIKADEETVEDIQTNEKNAPDVSLTVESKLPKETSSNVIKIEKETEITLSQEVVSEKITDSIEIKEQTVCTTKEGASDKIIETRTEDNETGTEIKTSETAMSDSDVDTTNSTSETVKEPVEEPPFVEIKIAPTTTSNRDSYQVTKEEIKDDLEFIKAKLATPPLPPAKTKRASKEVQQKKQDVKNEETPSSKDDTTENTIIQKEWDIKETIKEEKTEEKKELKPEEEECVSESVPPIRPERLRKPCGQKRLSVPDWQPPKQSFLNYLLGCFRPTIE